MTKLNQIIAVEKGTKSAAYSAFTNAHHRLQKGPLLSGIARTYQPKDDEGERFPSESTKVQVKTRQVVVDVTEAQPSPKRLVGVRILIPVQRQESNGLSF